MAAQAELYDDIEQLNMAEYHREVFDAFIEQFEYTYSNSPFYREKFDEHDVNRGSITKLEDIESLPFTEKGTLRQSQEASPPFGRHMACEKEDIARVYSSSGTTGQPTIIGLTKSDMDTWIEAGVRAAYAAGLRSNDNIVGTSAGGPFVGGLLYDAYQELGSTIIPVGHRTDRIIRMFTEDCGNVITCSPSYAQYLIEQVEKRDIDPLSLGIDHMKVGGEPGAHLIRDTIAEAFGCTVTETMGNGDMSVSIWGECRERNGMHFTGQNGVFPELIDPDTSEPLKWKKGTRGELVYTSLNRECVPLIRFRVRDHVEVTETNCDCGRGTPCIRGIGRTDNMFHVRGVNVFPSAVQDVISKHEKTTGHVRIILDGEEGSQVSAPVHVKVEVIESVGNESLARELESSIRDKLQFQAAIELVPKETFERSQHKSNLIKYRHENTE